MELVDEFCAACEVEELAAPDTLNWDELRKLAGDGVTLGAHTRTHAALTQLGYEAIAEEISGSLGDLQQEIGHAPSAFCFPYGLFSDRAIDALRKQGIEIAFTCLEGHNHLPSAEPLKLRRTVVTKRTSPLLFGLRLLKAVSYVDMWRHRARSSTSSKCELPSEDKPAEQPGSHVIKVAYVMSRFPKITETFVLNEMIALRSLGADVHLYPLLKERQAIAHPEVDDWIKCAHFHPFMSLSVIRANTGSIRSQGRVYFNTLWELVRQTIGSRNFLIGGLAIFPKSVLFASWMKRDGIEHIHAHFCNHPATSAWIIHRLTGIPFSFTAHGSDLHVERRMLDTKVQAAAFAVTISRFNKEVMVQTCGEQTRRKIHVIHCGVDTACFVPPERPAHGPVLEIVCVASLEPVKGHRYLIEACRLLVDRGIEFRCHLVGDGPVRREILLHVTRSKLDRHVLLHGIRARPRVAQLLSEAHVAVLTSHPTPDGKREGIPVALMEAMASGLPVLATNISGIPELVDHEVTGILVPPGSTEAMADALERLGRSAALRQRMGQAGRNKVLQSFDLTANSRKLLEMYISVRRSRI
jgi:glycosyltransferase involved in cell wall biosynthesis